MDTAESNARESDPQDADAEAPDDAAAPVSSPSTTGLRTEKKPAADGGPGGPRPEATGDHTEATGASPGKPAQQHRPGTTKAPADRIRTPAPAARPRRPQVAYPAGALPAVVIAGVVAAVTVPVDGPGIGWLLAGTVAVGAVTAVHRRAVRSAAAEEPAVRSDRGRLWWTVAALALLSVGAFRAAGWLFLLCLAAAAVAGSLAVVDRRSARGLFRDAVAVPLAAAGAVRWVYDAQRVLSEGAGSRRRNLGVSGAVTAGLLVVFVPLLAGADATFATWVDALVPRMDGGTLTRWAGVSLVVGIGCLGAVYLLAGAAADSDRRTGAGRRTLRRAEWSLPVGALTAVFALFVGAQLMALFGGDDYVQRTAGLTYAEYARGGFWQLSAVTVLTLAVILPVLHRAATDSASDRRWLRGLLCAISGLTLVMIASALGRMWTYQQAYGFTVLRILVGTCELWLGLVYILVIVAVLRLRLAWLPRAGAATAVAALLTLAALNPEGLVAQENIDRWQRGEDIDIDYLAGLSVDIVPAIDRLPAAIRLDLHHRLGYQLDGDTWNSWNLARARAR
ncbi:DUF4153 domain-containing protein [Nocardia sp. NPDC003963]